MKYNKLLSYSFFVALFFICFAVNTVNATQIDPPILIDPNESFITGSPKPYITGLTINDSFIYLYIDGVYNGKTKILTHKSGTANFAHKPFLNLKVGSHFAWAIAENKEGVKSKISNILKFKIEQAMPAPTLIALKQKQDDNFQIITGLAKNDSKIKIFINHRLYYQFEVKNDISGTANFSYVPKHKLARGSHFVHTTATDSRGKESIWSNIIYFTVNYPRISKVAQDLSQSLNTEVKINKPEIKNKEVLPIVSEKIETKVETKKEISNEKENNKNNIFKKDDLQDVENQKSNDEDKIKEVLNVNAEISDEDIKKIIKDDVSEENVSSGVINQDKKHINELNWGLIIFISFLLGVIMWIFWINKELVKESKKE